MIVVQVPRQLGRYRVAPCRGALHNGRACGQWLVSRDGTSIALVDSLTDAYRAVKRDTQVRRVSRSVSGMR